MKKINNAKDEFSCIYVKTKRVSCEGSSAVSKHPLVYLSILPKGRVKCPYCGIEYVYQGDKDSQD